MSVLWCHRWRQNSRCRSRLRWGCRSRSDPSCRRRRSIGPADCCSIALAAGSSRLPKFDDCRICWRWQKGLGELRRERRRPVGNLVPVRFFKIFRSSGRKRRRCWSVLLRLWRRPYWHPDFPWWNRWRIPCLYTRYLQTWCCRRRCRRCRILVSWSDHKDRRSLMSCRPRHQTRCRHHRWFCRWPPQQLYAWCRAAWRWRRQ